MSELTTIPQDTEPSTGLLDEPPTRNHVKRRRKNNLLRRNQPDVSQRWRHGFQMAFLILNLWLGGQFYLWVRQFEGGAPEPSLARPTGIEGWLPIAGLMNLKYWLSTGHVPSIHPAAMFLLLAFVAIAFLFRKAFCSWLCPVGTVSEYLWRAGRKIFGRNFRLPGSLDTVLRGLKYLLLAFFLWAVFAMTATAIQQFMNSPFGLIADVKMLDFFRFPTATVLWVMAALALASLLIQNFWCRYLCPYGALLGLIARLSPLKVRRDAARCIDCARCAKVCPARLPVDKRLAIKSVECTACLECVAVCPVKGALDIELPRRGVLGHQGRRTPAWVIGLGMAAVFLVVVELAKVSGHWQSQVPRSVYRELIPHASEVAHPMPTQ